jgi:arylsulfatase A-like enzyme
MKKYIFLFSSTLLVGYMLWPLDGSRHAIVFDQEKVQFREEFLKENDSRPDTARQPNILLILADDLGKTDISLYGSPHVKTPHIDAIGHNGVVFTEGYVSTPICSPSRAALLTGRYQQRFGFEYQPHERYARNRLEVFVFKHLMNTGDWLVADNPAAPREKDKILQGLPPTEITLAELLKKEGYRTAAIGKWHLGYNEAAEPHRRGFDYHYGFYEAFTLYGDPKDPRIVNQRHTDFSDSHIWGKGRKGTAAIRRNGQVIEESGFLTDRIAEEAVQFMEANRDQPFFLYVPFLTPHTPFQITQEYFDRFAHVEDVNKRVYYAMIQSLDDAVGQIMEKLRELGLEENTVVFFLSDNGGAAYTLATDNAPLKGGKFTFFEGGLNVPFMMQWKGRIPAGSAYDQPVIAMDVFTSAAALAGCSLPPDRPYDGKNLLPYLLENRPDAPHEALYWRSDNLRAIRKRNWKLVFDEKSGDEALYDLQLDKTERNDLSEQRPEVVRELKSELARWEEGLLPPSWPRVMNYRFRDGEKVFYFPL